MPHTYKGKKIERRLGINSEGDRKGIVNIRTKKALLFVKSNSHHPVDQRGSPGTKELEKLILSPHPSILRFPS